MWRCISLDNLAIAVFRYFLSAFGYLFSCFCHRILFEMVILNFLFHRLLYLRHISCHSPKFIGFGTCPSQLFVPLEIIDKFACACQAGIMMKTLGEFVLFIWSKFKVTSNLAAEQEYRGAWPENIRFPLQAVGGVTLSSTYMIVALQGSFDTGYQVLQEMFYPFYCFLH